MTTSEPAEDPFKPGYGLPRVSSEPFTVAGGPDSREPPLVLRPRAMAWLWITPIALCGLVLAGCNAAVLFGAQASSADSTSYFVAVGLLGLCIAVIPVANFVNAEVRLEEGVVTKRGVFRTTRRWRAQDLQQIHAYVRWMSGDYDFLDYVVYRFMLKDGGIAFTLSQAWWKTSQVEALAKRLQLSLPAPSQR